MDDFGEIDSFGSFDSYRRLDANSFGCEDMYSTSLEGANRHVAPFSVFYHSLAKQERKKKFSRKVSSEDTSSRFQSPIKGKVKFFNKLKGFGFLADDDGNEYYFNYHQLKDFRREPRVGDKAEFQVKYSKNSGKRPCAVSISLFENSEFDKEDSRLLCPFCGMKFVPRWRQGLFKWIPYCPFCHQDLDKTELYSDEPSESYLDNIEPEKQDEAPEIPVWKIWVAIIIGALLYLGWTIAKA